MADGFSIAFAPLAEADPAPLSALQPMIWDVLGGYAWRFTNTVESLWDDYLGRAGPEHWFGVGERDITFSFPDFDGTRTVSAAVGKHWLMNAFAANFDVMSALAQDHGWLPATAKPSLAADVWRADRSHAWILVEEQMYEFDFAKPELDGGFRHDGGVRPFTDFGDEDREVVVAAHAAKLCPCPMCVMLRPDRDFETRMVEAIHGDDPEITQTAIWYLRQTARLSVDSALAAARHGEPPHRDHAMTCLDFGEKLDQSAAPVVLDALQAAIDPLERAGLLGLAAGLRPEDAASRERRLFTFVSALATDSVRDIAAELAGYGGIARDHEDHFARGLVAHLGASDEYDHNVALTLFNFYLRAHDAPRFAVEAIARLAQHRSEHVRTIAAFAHQQLSTKPLR